MLTGDVPFKAESQVAVAMKHVKDPLPDIRMRRPEISAALASVVDTACAKETDNRFATAGDMVHELEHALVIETSRSGTAHGEATSVLRSLPDDTAEFGAIRRLRHPRRGVVLSIVAALLVAAGIVFAVSRAERGTTGGARVSGVPDLTPVKLSTAGARDFDPDGDDTEHPEEVRLAIDGQVGTRWETETYSALDLQKDGVGLIIEARAPVAARALDVITPEPGWAAEVYASDDRPGDLESWGLPLGSAPQVGEEQRIDLDTAGQEFRYYLLWITALPEGKPRASVAELTLGK
jgi:serine/threonine-protein kinase